MENSKLRLILASASPRRKELISHLKIPFEVMATDIAEVSTAQDPLVFSKEIAALKAQAAAESLKQQKAHQSFLVAGDTIVFFNGRIYGKPKDRNEARSILLELSGRTHSVFTAVEVRLLTPEIEKSFSFVEETKVTFNKCSDFLLERYLDTGDSLDKAGAYGIQGPSLTFISKIEGDYANVVGFPLSRFVVEMEDFFKPILLKKGMKKELWPELF